MENFVKNDNIDLCILLVYMNVKELCANNDRIIQEYFVSDNSL